MMLKAINKALSDGMKMPEVQEALLKCGYDLTVTTEVNTNLLEIMFEVPDDLMVEEYERAKYHAWVIDEAPSAFAFSYESAAPLPPPDGAEFFDMAERGVGIYRRATISKLWNPNFVSAMALLGSPLNTGGDS